MSETINGLVYIIEPKCEHDECDRYYGSTTQKKLSVRYAGHLSDYRSWKNGKHNFLTSLSLFEKYGVENCHIVLVENFPCGSKYELQAREAFYIRNNPCVNKYIPNGKSKSEHRESKTGYNRTYYLKKRQDLIDNLKQPRFCPFCDCVVQYGSVARHKNSKKHIANTAAADAAYGLV